MWDVWKQAQSCVKDHPLFCQNPELEQPLDEAENSAEMDPDFSEDNAEGEKPASMVQVTHLSPHVQDFLADRSSGAP